MMLHLDFTDLKERLGVCVLRDVFHDFLCVWSEARSSPEKIEPSQRGDVQLLCMVQAIPDARPKSRARPKLPSTLIPVAVEP
jgi:hypothetical protein